MRVVPNALLGLQHSANESSNVAERLKRFVLTPGPALQSTLIRWIA